MKRLLAMVMLVLLMATGCVKVTVVEKTPAPISASVAAQEVLTLKPEQSGILDSSEDSLEEPMPSVQVPVPISVDSEKPAKEPAEEQTEAPMAAAEEISEEKEPERLFSSDIIYFEEDVSDELLFAIQANFEKVPSIVRSHFADSGWHIEVVSGLGPRFGYASILGLTVYAEKVIYIDNRTKAAETIIHEMGHYWDVYGNTDCQHISNGEEFSTIWSAEVGGFRSFWSTNTANTASAVEYFAESFEAFVTDPQGLATVCPETYAYIGGYFPV